MFSNAIIFRKLQSLFNQLNNENQHYFSFAPVPVSFTNDNFNFLQSDLPAAELKGSIENQMMFAYFANAIIRDDKIWGIATEDFLQNSYKKIFDDALLIDASVLDADKQKYKDARAVLFLNDALDPTPAYTKYLSLKTKYNEITAALSAVIDKVMSNPEDAAAAQQKQELETKQSIIFNDWLIDGGKEEIERALKVVQNSNARAAFTNKWNEERNSLNAKLQNLTTVNSNIDFLPVSCLPSGMFQYGFEGWKKVSIERDEITKLETEVKDFFGQPFYDAADDGNEDVSRIDFEYLFVSILRNWFKPELVNSNFWSFDSASGEVASDESNLNNGLLPSYIDKFVFIRRVCVFNKTEETKPVIAETKTTPKIFVFKDFTRLKKIGEIKAVKPIDDKPNKFLLINSQKVQKKPIIMKSKGSSKTTLLFNGGMFLQPTMHSIKSLTFKDRSGPGPFIKGKFVKPVDPGLIKNIGVVKVFPVGPKPNPQPPRTNFNLELILTDNLGNNASAVNVKVEDVDDGTSYLSETGNDGKVFFPALAIGGYKIIIQGEELYEDNSLLVNITNNDISQPLVLQRRANPRFSMFLIGAINYRFPKLPDPLDGYTYS